MLVLQFQLNIPSARFFSVLFLSSFSQFQYCYFMSSFVLSSLSFAFIAFENVQKNVSLKIPEVMGSALLFLIAISIF